MSFVCYRKSDELHAQEKLLQGLRVSDLESACTYFKEYLHHIYNNKMFGCVYDIYADHIQVLRENAVTLDGIQAIEHDVAKLCTAFPDLRVTFKDVFGVPNGETGYKIWMRYYFTGTNTGYSIYGAPTGLAMTGDQGLNLSVLYIEQVEDEWLIVKELTGRPSEYIRAICTGDSSFSATLSGA